MDESLIAEKTKGAKKQNKSKGGSTTKVVKHGHKQTQEFDQTGFNLVDRIYEDRKYPPSMHEIGFNDDFDSDES